MKQTRLLFLIFFAIGCLTSCKTYRDYAFSINHDHFSEREEKVIGNHDLCNDPINLFIEPNNDNAPSFVKAFPKEVDKVFLIVDSLTKNAHCNLLIDSINYQYLFSTDQYEDMLAFKMSNKRYVSKKEEKALLEENIVNMYGATLTYQLQNASNQTLYKGRIVALPTKANTIAFERSNREKPVYLSKDHFTLYTNSKPFANYFEQKGHFVSEAKYLEEDYVNSIPFLENFRFIIYPKKENGQLIGDPTPFFLTKKEAAKALWELLEKESKKWD